MKAILSKRDYNIKNKLIIIPASKNSALALLPAILLAKGVYQISNLGQYSDIKTMVCLLEQCNINYYSENNIFDSNKLEIPAEFHGCEKIRASYYLAGATAHSKQIIKIALPGGCRLGNEKRKIDEHIRVLEFAGCQVVENDYYLVVDSTNYQTDFSGEFIFNTKSIGATVNAILAFVKGSGTIILNNVECDPIITELVKLLNRMNGKITIYSNENKIIIDRVENLSATNFSIIPDPIITGTYIIFVAMQEKPIDFIIGPYIKDNMGNFSSIIEKLGIALIPYSSDYYQISVSKCMEQNITIETGSFPDLYTDLQPFIALYLHYKKINAIIIDQIMPGRYYYAVELDKLGYRFQVDGNKLITSTNLLAVSDNKLGCHDLRGSMALMMAGSMAILDDRCDQIVIGSYSQIERGYLDVSALLKNFNIECVIVENITNNMVGWEVSKNLSEICNIGIGGTVKYYTNADTYQKLISSVKKCISLKMPYRVIGDGTNIYFENVHYNGAIIYNSTSFITKVNHYPSDDGYGYFIVATGTNLNYLVNYLATESYDISELAGIPGTLGGAIYGNAGAYGKEMKDIVRLVTIIKPNGEIANFSKEDLYFRYRKSILSELNGHTIVSAVIGVKRDDKDTIKQKITNIISLRNSKLPTNEKTAGSFFKNFNLSSSKIPAGHLITKLKEVSSIDTNSNIKLYEKHDNIIINNNNASHEDLTTFINQIRENSLEHFGIWLDNEVFCISPKDLWTSSKNNFLSFAMKSD